MTKCWPGRRSERGMVTVELAFAALIAGLLTVALVGLVGVGILQARCHETAAEVARQEARLDAAAVARALSDRPAGSRVLVQRRDGLVTVTVTVVAQPLGSLSPGTLLTARASVLVEGR